MTRIVIWPAGDLHRDGSAAYRLGFPGRALAAQGADVTIDHIGPRVHWDRPWSGEHAPLDARPLGCDPVDADVAVIQRPARWHWTALIPHLRSHGTRVVVDVDDLFAAIPRGNLAHDALDPARSPGRNHRWVRAACDAADLVTVTTPALARAYGQHGRVVVLPNLVPAAYLRTDAERLPGTVGWTGSTKTHPHDLESTAGGVARALAETGWRMHVVGTGDGVREALRLDHDPTTTGWVPVTDYPAEMARPALGVVPLTLSRFNAGKSALKMSEFAALGVPVIASPTPDNRRLHANGVGWLARTGREWQAALTTLIHGEQLRADLAGAGRAAMAGLTYERCCGRWWDAWTAALASSRAA